MCGITKEFFSLVRVYSSFMKTTRLTCSPRLLLTIIYEYHFYYSSLYPLINPGKSVEYLTLGCFIDNNNTRAIPSLESVNATYLDGPFRTRDNAITKCALEAAKMGYKMFAVQDGGACYSGPNAHYNYSVHGAISCPAGGKGGDLVNEVYLLGGWCIKMY